MTSLLFFWYMRPSGRGRRPKSPIVNKPGALGIKRMRRIARRQTSLASSHLGQVWIETPAALNLIVGKEMEEFARGKPEAMYPQPQ